VTVEAAVDNDVLIKGAAYDLLDATLEAFGGAVGVLGVARFVVSKRIAKHGGIADRAAAEARWKAFLAEVAQLEPTAEELELATSIEAAAVTLNLPLDAGESQLCAITIARALRVVVSGDKRAVGAVEVLLDVVDELDAVAGRWVSLEQLVLALADRLEPQDIRAAICGEPGVDRALTISMGCASGLAWSDEGLRSYIEHLRGVAPRALCPGAVFG
jgi:hypothetical protein